MDANRAPHQAQCATRRSRVRFSVFVDIAASLLDSFVGLLRPHPVRFRVVHGAGRCDPRLFAPTIRVSDRVRPAPDGVHRGIPVPVPTPQNSSETNITSTRRPPACS
jgi:hypothetical protein